EFAARNTRDRVRHGQHLTDVRPIGDEMLRAETKADADPLVGRAFAAAGRCRGTRKALELEQQLERPFDKRGETQALGPSARRSSTSWAFAISTASLTGLTR